jgi:hypothetical protein
LLFTGPRAIQTGHHPAIRRFRSTTRQSLHRAQRTSPLAFRLKQDQQSDRRLATLQAIKQTNVEGFSSRSVIHRFKAGDSTSAVGAAIVTVEVPGPAVVIAVRSDVDPIGNLDAISTPISANTSMRIGLSGALI